MGGDKKSTSENLSSNLISSFRGILYIPLDIFLTSVLERCQFKIHAEMASDPDLP